MSKYIQRKRQLSYEKENQERINKKSGNHNLQEKEINKQYEKRLDDSSKSLKEDMKKLKLIVNNLEKKIKLLIEENQVFEKKIEILLKENHQIKSENHKIIYIIQEMDLKNNNLKEEIKSKNKRICSLEQTVKELSNFIFSTKIRKLLKRLLEYIVINYYDPYMNYDKIQRKLYFKKAPKKLSFLNRSESEIVLILNNLIKTIFSYSKVSDFVIHFVIKEE